MSNPQALRRLGAVALVGGVLAVPWLPFVSLTLVGRLNLAAQYALVAISLVILTGWVGQISLAQGAFVGMGAYAAGFVNSVIGVPFPLTLVGGVVAGAGVAALLGVVALRVRGMYLAVATLVFAWTADAFLFQQRWLTQYGDIEPTQLGTPGAWVSFDFTDRRTVYYISWACVAVTVLLVANLRDRKTGRGFFAVRGSEMASAALGINVIGRKLTAFALSGGIAGAAGTLMLAGSQVVTVDQFSLEASLFYLAVAVVGGLMSLAGAVASGVLFAGMEELFFRVPFLGDYLGLVAAVLLLLVLVLYPGGLAALGRALQRVLSGARTRAVAGVPGRVVSKATASLREAKGAREARAAERARHRQAEEEPAAAEVQEEEVSGSFAPTSDEDRGPGPIRGLLERVFPGLAAARRAQQARGRIDTLSLQQARGRPGVDESDDEAAAAEEAPFTAAHGPGPERAADDETVELDEVADEVDATAPAWETEGIEDHGVPPEEREERRALIEARGVTKRFGGLVAVNDFSLSVREGEIVGLIGPNGAGKTTLFNCIAGFLEPTSGSVHLHGMDVTDVPVHLRSRLGVARTFQVIQLFPQLTVFDNLLVATYLDDPTGLFANMLATNHALDQERQCRERVQAIVDLLGLEDVADRRVAGLPFGVLRMVEVARALVTGAPLVMLDEPASGLDDNETERLAKLVRFIRSLGVTILLIEHDVQMVTGVSDYMYVIDRGNLIAQGSPEAIQADEAVIAAYLGEPVEAEKETARAGGES